MSGTYGDPKGSKWHTPGKVDHSTHSTKDVLVDGNNNPTKIGIETLENGDAGEQSRGVGQVNISAEPPANIPSEASIRDHPERGADSKDERLATRGAQDRNAPPPLTVEREQRQYSEGNKPHSDKS